VALLVKAPMRSLTPDRPVAMASLRPGAMASRALEPAPSSAAGMPRASAISPTGMIALRPVTRQPEPALPEQ